eukprot:5500157-Lingulodinium_polyedra.AAC.1
MESNPFATILIQRGRKVQALNFNKFPISTILWNGSARVLISGAPAKGPAEVLPYFSAAVPGCEAAPEAGPCARGQYAHTC